MNGAEQVARFSATQRLEKRLEDLELVVETMAVEIVKGRELHDQQHREIVDGVNQALGDLGQQCRQRGISIRESAIAFEHQTFWQRLRWLVRGV